LVILKKLIFLVPATRRSTRSPGGIKSQAHDAKCQRACDCNFCGENGLRQISNHSLALETAATVGILGGCHSSSHAHALEIVNPRPFAVPAIAAVYANYPHLHSIWPAMGYSPEQLTALEETINNTPADVVVAATPIDLDALIEVNKPIVRAYHEFAEASEPGLAAQVKQFLIRAGIGHAGTLVK
jgi:hypothetical protein